MFHNDVAKGFKSSQLLLSRLLNVIDRFAELLYILSKTAKKPVMFVFGYKNSKPFKFHRFAVHFDSLNFFTPTHALSHTTMY
jgi:hypothetical protein